MWYIIDSGYVFYIGKGHADRYKKISKRNKRFNYYIDNYKCDCAIIKDNLSEEDAFNLEIEYIKYYKSLNMADANYHIGGKSGGNVFQYMPFEEKQEFVDKMTVINKERCNTDEFKEKARNRMINKYSDKNERELQSKKIKDAWNNDELRERQSNMVKQYRETHPEYVNRLIESHCKKCILEFNGEKTSFNSKKELFKYLNDKYNIQLSRKTEQYLFNTGNQYKAFHKSKSYMDGMRLYYE